MTTLKDLMAQKEALEKQIAETRTRELSDAIRQVRSLIEAHGLTQKDVFETGSRGAKTRMKASKVAAKYRDPLSGKEWTGRGKAPRWLDGKDKMQYLIAG